MGEVSIVKQLGFLVDLSRCIGCKGCEMACQNEHRLGEVHRRKIHKFTDRQEKVITFLSLACNHCANPACIGVCPKNCFKKRRDGIVLHNATNCDGCGSCVGACPYGAPQFNQKTGKVDKCNLCAERVEKGLKPACVAACLCGGIQVIDLAKITNSSYHETLPGFANVLLTNPSLRFILPRLTTRHWRS